MKIEAERNFNTDEVNLRIEPEDFMDKAPTHIYHRVIEMVSEELARRILKKIIANSQIWRKRAMVGICILFGIITWFRLTNF